MLPLQVIDTLLLDYEVGQALLLGFVLATVAALGLGSRKVVALDLSVFGLVFLMTPQAVNSKVYLFLGLALVVVGPMLYAVSDD